jgi:hypothetical protein
MRAQVDMKIVYLALSLVIIGIFVNLIWPMITSSQEAGEKARENITEYLNQ